MLFDLNSVYVQHHEKVFITGKEKDLTQIQSAHASLNMNFIEAVYRMKLQNDSFLEPAISSLIKIYYHWYEKNKQFYSEDFRKYMENQYKIMVSKNN